MRGETVGDWILQAALKKLNIRKDSRGAGAGAWPFQQILLNRLSKERVASANVEEKGYRITLSGRKKGKCVTGEPLTLGAGGLEG